MLSSLVQSWYDKWKETASKSRTQLVSKAPEVLDPRSLRELMYDDLSMGRSEFLLWSSSTPSHIFRDDQSQTRMIRGGYEKADPPKLDRRRERQLRRVALLVIHSLR